MQGKRVEIGVKEVKEEARADDAPFFGVVKVYALCWWNDAKKELKE